MANLGTPVLKNSTFNFDHSNITTCNFGAYQPILAYEAIPKAKIKFRPVSMVRLTNMVAPTYGLMKLKTTCGFVPMRLVYPNFTQFLAGQQVNTQDGAFIPTKLPTFKMRQLIALMAFYPAMSYSPTLSLRDTASISLRGSINGGNTHTFTQEEFDEFFNNSVLQFNRYYGEDVQAVVSLSGSMNSLVRNDGEPNTLPYFSFGQSLDDSNKLTEFAEYGFRLLYRGTAWDSVDIANIGWTFSDSINLKRLLVAFRGVGINIPDTLSPDSMDFDDLSILPFIAYVRLYLEHLVPQRDFVFEDSATYKFINYLTSHDGFDIITSNTSLLDMFMDVVHESLTMFYTLPPDVFTSALNTINSDSFSMQVRTSDSDNNNETVYSNEEYAPRVQTPDSFSATLISNLLATLKYSNRNTVTGRNVMNWLRSRFGVVPDAIKDNHSYFLGTQNTDIKVTDLYATANSETGSFGRLLGSYTGRGGAFKRGKMITFRTEEFGYFICMQVLVPQVEYYQGISPHVYRTKRFDFYTSEYDGKSYDAIHYSQLNAGHVNSEGTYGFYPRYSDYKYITGSMNGDFRMNTQDISAFHLYRVLGDDFVLDDNFRRLVYDSIQSGDESFLRIFANTDAKLDHFIIFNPLEFKVSQPCKPLSKSYEVEDNGNDEFRVDYT